LHDFLALPPEQNIRGDRHSIRLKHFTWSMHRDSKCSRPDITVTTLRPAPADKLPAPHVGIFASWADALLTIAIFDAKLPDERFYDAGALLQSNGFVEEGRDFWRRQIGDVSIFISIWQVSCTLIARRGAADEVIASLGDPELQSTCTRQGIIILALLNLLNRRLAATGSVSTPLSQPHLETWAGEGFKPLDTPFPADASRPAAAAAVPQNTLRFERAASTSLEIAHHGTDGKPHGHSLILEVWTFEDTCLDTWRDRITAATRFIGDGFLEDTIGGRTFEDVASAVLRVLPEASRLTLRLPSLGHAIEARRA
jgi:hypothetical protein